MCICITTKRHVKMDRRLENLKSESLNAKVRWFALKSKSYILFYSKVKKGVRRKADTTTPGSNVRTLDHDPPLDVTATIRPLRKTRAAVGNAGRKQKRESMNRHTTLLKPNLSKPLEYCREILQELLGPEHSVGFCFYIFLVFSVFLLCSIIY